jgi:hypothetical protein
MGVSFLAMLGTGWRIARGFQNVAGRGSGGGYLFDGGSLGKSLAGLGLASVSSLIMERLAAVLLVTVFFTQVNDVQRGASHPLSSYL